MKCICPSKNLPSTAIITPTAISNRNMYSDTDIAEKIQNHLHPDHVEVEDLSDGCGSKFKITVVSDKFDGKNSLACHRLVQGAIKEAMESIHAVTISTFTPQKWEEIVGKKPEKEAVEQLKKNEQS
uniref:BolA-like protein n=1 Tax=Acrobeloides nanus TaxID=290746 RepID=A0A914BXH0_9BILA